MMTQFQPRTRARLAGGHIIGESMTTSEHVGPTCFNMSAPFERLVFMYLRIPTMFLGIVRRKAVVLSEPKWVAAVESDP